MKLKSYTLDPHHSCSFTSIVDIDYKPKIKHSPQPENQRFTMRERLQTTFSPLDDRRLRGSQGTGASYRSGSASVRTSVRTSVRASYTLAPRTNVWLNRSGVGVEPRNGSSTNQALRPSCSPPSEGRLLHCAIAKPAESSSTALDDNCRIGLHPHGMTGKRPRSRLPQLEQL